MVEPEDAGNPGESSYRRAVALLDGLTAAGMTNVVISPGSRSTPLALAAARCSALRLHVVIDERSAAFFALGLARATGRPPVLISTSGSAPAHWLPAAIEACEDEQPLVMLSADRPAELLDCGANQATAQGQLFAAHARALFALPADATVSHAHDAGRRAAAACDWPRRGPVHINVAFREPLLAPDPATCAPWSPGAKAMHAAARILPDLEAIGAAAARLGGRKGAILAGRLPPGDPSAPAVSMLARALDCAVIADPLSGLRAGTEAEMRVLAAASAWLRDPGAPVPDWLIRVGLPPVSRHVEEWAARCPDTLLIARTPSWTDPLRSARTVLLGDPAATLTALAATVSRAGLRAAEWKGLDERDAAAQEALAALRPPPAEAQLVRAICTAACEDTPVFVGNSLVVRDFDSFLPRRAEPMALYANRGVSGIDGNLSTAAGIVAGAGQPGFAVLGDLALFHDLNGLSLCRNVPLVVVVINNGGGAIFGQLAQSGLPEFETLWLTPSGLDLARAAALFGLDFARLEPGEDIAARLSAALRTGRSMLLELIVDRHASHAAREAWWSASRARVQGNLV